MLNKIGKLKEKFKTHKDEVIIWMDEWVRMPKARELTTIGVSGCTVCIISGVNENFLHHTSAEDLKKAAKGWAEVKKTILKPSVTVYIGVLQNTEGKYEISKDDLSIIKDIKSKLQATVIPYKIGAAKKVTIKGNTITTSLEVIK